MTREKALKANRLLVRIESYETLIDAIRNLEELEEINIDRGESDLEDELVAVVQARLDQALKELEEL
jgi:hypothetical protein